MPGQAIRAIARNDAGRYETLVVRGDGVTFHVQGVAHAFAGSHDLAHYLVETLKIEHRIWGPIAPGAVLPTLTYFDGHAIRRPLSDLPT
jgi:acid stress-induced BolA-like protein IbaG/YrbA